MASPEDLATEFDAAMRRAGLTIPASRRASVLTGYAEFRAQMDLLRDRYAYTDEPANIFRMTPPEATR